MSQKEENFKLRLYLGTADEQTSGKVTSEDDTPRLLAPLSQWGKAYFDGFPFAQVHHSNAWLAVKA